MITQPEKFVFIVHEFGLYNGHGGIAAYTYYNVKQILETCTDLNVYVLSPSKKGFEDLKKNKRFHHIYIVDADSVYKALKDIQPEYVEIADFGALALKALLQRNDNNEFPHTVFGVYHHAASKECFEWNYKRPICFAASEIQALSGQESLQMQLADFNICPSLFMKNYIRQHYAVLNNIFILPPYITLPSQSEINDFFDFDTYSDSFNIVCISRIDGIKNQSYLVDQFIKFKTDRQINTKLFLAGHSYDNIYTGESFREELYKQIPEEHREDIYFFDYLDEKSKSALNKIANVFVLPSIFETFSLIVVEEALCGLPVICSEFVGCSSAISDISKDLLFNPFKKDSLKECLNFFYKLSPQERQNTAMKQKSAFQNLIEQGTVERKLQLFRTMKQSKNLTLSFSDFMESQI